MEKGQNMNKKVILFTFLLVLLPSCLGSTQFMKTVRASATWTSANNRLGDFQMIQEDSDRATIKHRSKQVIKSHLSDELDAQLMDAFHVPFEASGRLDFENEVGWDDLTYVDDDSVELVIGLSDMGTDGYSEVMDLIMNYGGKVADTVSMGGKISAVVADIPHRFVSTLVSEAKITGLSRYIEPNMRFEIDFVPNDPDWPKQWGPRIIKADYAWNTTIGDPSVLVAVIDTGIDWNHPDLAANYVPLGYDWVNNDADPMDDNGHGTHCAGIIAAVLNNSIGIAGLAQVSIMTEKALDEFGEGYEDDLANAIIHAVDQGANIISNSWGGYEESTLIHDAIKYAFDSKVLVIASAGNDFTSTKAYPAAYDEVIAVSATDEFDKPAAFTNFGDWISVSAPGVNIYSTVGKDSYTYMSGTSMSAPFVAGVAALVWSQFPNMTRDQVLAQLQYTSDDLGDPGFDVYYGFGRVNAKEAVERALSDHDVLVLNLKVSSIVRRGEVVVINSTVLNMGKRDERSLTMQLLVNGTVVHSETISFLARGKSSLVSYSWNTSQVIEGVYKVTSYVVPVQGETLVENNAFSKNVWVRNPKVFRVPDDCKTIQSAIDVAFEGDTILVSSGTYHENVWINKQFLTLVGEDRANTIIDGNETSDVVVVTADNVEISNFTLRNGGKDPYPYPPLSGILLYCSNNCTIRNTSTSKNFVGIFLFRSPGTTLRHNSMSENRYNFGVDGYSSRDFIHDADESNTVEGKALCYWVNEHNRRVPSYAGCVVAFNCTGVVAKDLDLAKNYDGILFVYTANSSIENVKVSSNYIGIHLSHSDTNLVCDNNVTSAYVGVGVYLDKCRSNHISQNIVQKGQKGIEIYDSINNEIHLNNMSDNACGLFLDECNANSLLSNILCENFIGIWMYHSDENIVGVNEVSHDVYGIILTGAKGNVIRENTVTDNISVGNWIGVGLWSEQSFNNTIHHNNFVDNTFHIHSLESINEWDNGYPSGGNYWSGYTGSDQFNGPYQNETGSDGIGDTPYVIDPNNQDQYPLMNPWEVHDVCVVRVVPSTVEVYIGQVVKITVIVRNEGTTAETLVVTCVYELEGARHIIGTQTVSNIRPIAEPAVIFNWTTTDVTVHTIKAEIPSVPDETDTADNTMTSPATVKVKIKGDVNNDDKVDMRDIYKAAKAFGSFINHPRWNPQADINQDGKVDMVDIYHIAINLRKTYP